MNNIIELNREEVGCVTGGDLKDKVLFYTLFTGFGLAAVICSAYSSPAVGFIVWGVLIVTLGGYMRYKGE